MKKNAMRLGVTVLAALTLAGGGLSSAHAADEDGHGGHGDRKIVVKGDHNQIVTGNENVVGGGNVESSGHGEVEGIGEGSEASTPAEPYATVRSNVSYLSERSAPRTTATEIARFGPGTKIPVSCYVPNGEDVHGNKTWYKVRAENGFKTGYVAAYYTTLSGAANKC